MVTEENQNALVRQILSSRCLHFDRITSQPQSVVQKIVYKIFGDSQSEESLYKELLLRLHPRSRTSQSPSLSGDTISLVSTELPLHVSSRENMENYNQIETVDLLEGPEQVVSNGVQDGDNLLYSLVYHPDSSQTRLYPNISEFANAINI